MRFIKKTHYGQDIQLFKHGGQVGSLLGLLLQPEGILATMQQKKVWKVEKV